MPLDLVTAQAQLDYWLDANAKAATGGQAYAIQSTGGGRSMTRVNAAEILAQIKFWNTQVERLKRGGITVGYVVPQS